jgi:hypothetical protein
MTTSTNHAVPEGDTAEDYSNHTPVALNCLSLAMTPSTSAQTQMMRDDVNVQSNTITAEMGSQAPLSSSESIFTPFHS